MYTINHRQLTLSKPFPQAINMVKKSDFDLNMKWKSAVKIDIFYSFTKM